MESCARILTVPISLLRHSAALRVNVKGDRHLQLHRLSLQSLMQITCKFVLFAPLTESNWSMQPLDTREMLDFP